MSMKHIWITLALCGATASVAVAQSATERADFRAEVKAVRAALAQNAPPVPPGGADTDSFGRNVQFDGLLQAGTVTLFADPAGCTPLPGDPAPGPDDRCVVLNPAPGSTSFDFPDIGRLTIPGRSAHSLLCHWLTPIAFYNFQNSTGGTAQATFRLLPYVIVESSVLSDPRLIDPTTGLPFNGKLETSFAATYQDTQSLDPGHNATRRFSETRVCIGGFLSKANLMSTYGLTEAQATQVFRHDMTLRFGLRGNVALVNSSFVIYGLRVVGD
jgi:hypothetical protein